MKIQDYPTSQRRIKYALIMKKQEMPYIQPSRLEKARKTVLFLNTRMRTVR